jgi:hypothetical protein
LFTRDRGQNKGARENLGCAHMKYRRVRVDVLRAFSSDALSMTLPASTETTSLLGNFAGLF